MPGGTPGRRAELAGQGERGKPIGYCFCASFNSSMDASSAPIRARSLSRVR